MKGEAGEKVKLPEAIFNIKAAPELLAQSVRVFLNNQRRAIAKTKTRGEVKKTTAKMYKQKGTGRARHGSHSAPIFVGGGIAHGPDGKQNHKGKLNSTQSRLALFAAFSDKVKSDLAIVTGLKGLAKTKAASKLINKLVENRESLLLILALGQTQFAKAVRNLSQVTVKFSNQLSPYEILKHKKVAITEEALEEITKIFLKK
jgi:large subunit ribosomal protein L4